MCNVYSHFLSDWGILLLLLMKALYYYLSSLLNPKSVTLWSVKLKVYCTAIAISTDKEGSPLDNPISSAASILSLSL